MSLEEIVASYKTPTRARTNSLIIRCDTTGEEGSVRFFAERIAAVRKTQSSTERAKVYRALMHGRPYRNLTFTVIGKVPSAF